MSSLFFPFLVIHILSGTVCLLTGLIALLVPKKRGNHTKFGEIYHFSYVVLFISAIVTSTLHWSSDAYLFYIALFSYGLALLGYLARKKRWKNWLKSHIAGMCGSYIGVITAVIIVNHPHIPVINHLPLLPFWFIPTIIGTPLIIRTARKYERPRRVRPNENVPS